MNTLQRWTLTLAAGWALAACGGPGAQEEPGTEEETAAAEQAPAEQTPAPAPSPGMPGMEGMRGGQMMGRMQGHMQMMQGMSGDSMMGMMPQHQQMVGSMLSQMDRAMQDLNVPGDTAWNATADSVRDDVTRMQQMSPQELQQFMPAHHRRVMRLMEMHREMVQGRNR